MINNPVLKGFGIPEGKVIQFSVNGEVLWKANSTLPKYNYVSLGDSIAVGHRIDKNWETDYGWNAQYGKEGRTETVIVPNSYTDKIRKQLFSAYGEDRVSAKSFAVSGSVLKREPVDSRSLMDILDDEPVKNALSQANLVTISIGANTILEPALNIVSDFLMNGTDLSPTEELIENELRNLANPNYPYSYKALFDKLVSKNPNAQYVFTTVYNPMKYLYIERGTWENDFEDGFFGDWFKAIPDEYQITVLGVEVDKEIKKLIVDQDLLVNIRNRVNGNGDWEGISAWAERYIETGGVSANGLAYLGLNQVIRNAIKDYNNPNFSVTETHELFDTVPDRQGAGELHYNDLVNVQITRGYDANDLNWSALWGSAEGNTKEEKQANYWRYLLGKYLHIDLLKPSFNFDANGLVNEISPTLVNDILSPAFDPHPRSDGHYLMYRSFADTLGWQPLYTISYNANGGTGTMADQKVLDNSIVNGVSKKIYSILSANAFNAQVHYHFAGWKADNGNTYSNKQAIYVPANTVLDAQWEINTYILTVVQGTPDAVSLAKLFSRDYNNRKLYIGDFSRYLNSDKTTWDLPLKNTETFTVTYGEPIKMVVTGNVERIIPIGSAPKPNCTISQYDGNNYSEKVVAKVAEASFNMPDRNVTIEYHFNYSANIQYSHSYWLGYIGDKDLNVSYSGTNS